MMMPLNLIESNSISQDATADEPGRGHARQSHMHKRHKSVAPQSIAGIDQAVSSRNMPDLSHLSHRKYMHIEQPVNYVEPSYISSQSAALHLQQIVPPIRQQHQQQMVQLPKLNTTPNSVTGKQTIVLSKRDLSFGRLGAGGG